ncbi:MAG: D-alanyl-D-alanine carboxypeptidase family protein [Desulfobacter sp.]|nr:MAG: D-alanyl-D-alanine carboxypeptidase family protein [Desulfobacter sp.]
MNRREFLKSAGSAAAFGLAARMLAFPAGTAHALEDHPDIRRHKIPDPAIKDRLMKSRLYDRHFKDDILLAPAELPVFKSSLGRLNRIQRLVGYGNFCLLGFDEAMACGKSYARVGRFTREELQFLEKIFHSSAACYGFMGEKPITALTAVINRKKVRKIPRTGNYLFKGKPEKMYSDIRKQVGKDVVLTSGVRGVMKQFVLFLNKTAASGGNLSMASRSLAPPGYSFHGVGDFDVGKRGFGVDNFTEKFTRTRIYSRLSDLGYIKFRYDRKNELGVRFEPWHVEVV